MSETEEALSTEQSVEISRPVERIQLTAGRFTNNFLKEHPQVAKVAEVYPTISAFNSDRSRAIFGFAGFAQSHHDTYLKEQMPEFATNTPHAAITVDWSSLTDIPDMRWRTLADFMSAHYSQGISLFGTSYGGFEVLRGLKILNQLRQEGFAVPIKEVVLVVAPTSKDTVKRGKTKELGILLAKLEAGLGKASRNVVPRLMSRQTRELNTPFGKTSLADLRAIAVKTRNLIGSSAPKKGDFPVGLKVHYFGTDPEGNLDPLVDQPRAIEELRNAGVAVETHWYKPNPKFAHIPIDVDIKRMLQDAGTLFSS